MSRILDISEERYGRLFIVSFSHTEKGKSYSTAKCDCGKELIVSNNRVRSGNTSSCGCLLLKPGSAIRELYGKYVNRAKERDFVLAFDLKSFTEFVQRNCFYCDAAPSQVIKSFRGYESFVYNGIDRWNNSLGYTRENSVPCCGDCNRQKLKQSGEDFVSRCKKIASRADEILSKRNSNEENQTCA